MKAPEYFTSTPRLILVMMTIALVIFTYLGKSSPDVFKDVLLVVFGYFFGSRGSEPNLPKNSTQVTTTQTPVQSENIP